MSRVVAWTLGPDPDERAVGDALRALAPDVLLLADLPSGRGGLRRLASRADLQVATRVGRGRDGSAVLVGPDVRVLSSSSAVLGDAERQREAAHAILGVGGHTIQAVAFRLGVEPGTRRSDARAVATLVDGVERPAVLGGDLGEQPGGPAAALLLEGRVDVWASVGRGPGLTYPAEDPTARHDVLLLDDRLRPTAAQVPGRDVVGPCASHLPVVADLQDAS